MTLSMGVASPHTGQHLPLETLISSADEALYRAKRLGRNRVEVQFVQEHRSATDGSASLDLIAELQQVAG